VTPAPRAGLALALVFALLLDHGLSSLLGRASALAEDGAGASPAPPAEAAAGHEEGSGPEIEETAPESEAALRIRAVCASSSSPEEKARLLVALGPEALDALVAEGTLRDLAREWLPRVVEVVSDAELTAICRRWRTASEDGLERALEHLGESLLRAPLVEALLEEAGAPGGGPSRRAVDALARGVLARGPDALLAHLFGARPVTGTARILVAQALGASGRADVASSLALLLTEEAPVAATAAGALGRCPDPGGAAAGSLAEALRHPSPLVRRSAAFALGRLRAAEGIDALIALLDEREASPRPAPGASTPGAPARPPPPIEGAAAVATAQTEAHAALQAITGLRLVPREAAAWRAAVEEARHAADQELAVLLAEAASDDPAAAPAAARRLASHPVRRDRIRPVLLRLLVSRLPSERAVAAATLGALRDAAAAEPLIRALDDADAEVWAAAHLALKEALGLDLPPKAEVWRRRWLLNPVPPAPAAPARLRPARALPDDE